MAVSVACMAIYWPTPGFKGRTFKLCVLNRWDFNFCVRSSPLRDGARRARQQLHQTQPTGTAATPDYHFWVGPIQSPQAPLENLIPAPVMQTRDLRRSTEASNNGKSPSQPIHQPSFYDPSFGTQTHKQTKTPNSSSRNMKVCLFVSWCFEPSQPQRITSGLNSNFTLSPS